MREQHSRIREQHGEGPVGGKSVSCTFWLEGNKQKRIAAQGEPKRRARGSDHTGP